MSNLLPISDVAIWFKHVPGRALQERLAALKAEEEILLETDHLIGRWRRMKRGKDGRLPDAIIPVGDMKKTWNIWYQTRKGQQIEARLVTVADDYLTSMVPLFSEWDSAEDEAAFRDL